LTMFVVHGTARMIAPSLCNAKEHKPTILPGLIALMWLLVKVVLQFLGHATWPADQPP